MYFLIKKKSNFCFCGKKGNYYSNIGSNKRILLYKAWQSFLSSRTDQKSGNVNVCRLLHIES